VGVGGPSRPGLPTFSRHRGGSATASSAGQAARHQTALRGPAALPSRKATAAVYRRRLRNLSVPTYRRSKMASSTWATAQDRPGREESRPPSAGKRLPRAASAPLRHTRWSGRIGRAKSPARSVVGKPVAGVRANPNVKGSGVCRMATSRDRGPRRNVARRGRRGCPSSAVQLRTPGR
jgi:hypothetical protein